MNLTRMAHNGFAVGRLGGKVFFVPYAVPGETVRVEIVDEKPRWGRARLTEVLESSPLRCEPPCLEFGPDGCGGCHWQHIRPEAQREFKTGVVRDQISRLGGVDPGCVDPARSVGPSWEYRNHVQMRAFGRRLGFVSADKSRIHPVRKCLLMHPLVGSLFRGWAARNGTGQKVILRAAVGSEERLAVVHYGGTPDFLFRIDGLDLIRISGPEQTVFCSTGQDFIMEHAAGLAFRISRASFFQVNTAGVSELAAEVMRLLDPRSEDTILDCYSGVGLLSLAAAANVHRVIAIESDASAIRDARANAAASNIDNLEIREGDVATLLERWKEKVTKVVLDPPRRGCGREVVRSVTALRPLSVVYVACDPASLARDVRFFSGCGYQLKKVSPLDFFPQTYHVESVALFQPGG